MYTTPFMNEVLTLLKFMQSLGDAIASLEFNQRTTHTLWTESNDYSLDLGNIRQRIVIFYISKSRSIYYCYYYLLI